MALREGEFQWQPLPKGLLSVDSASGRSGWNAPFFVLRNESSGETVVGHLAWSGNWQCDFLLVDDDHGRTRQATLYARVGLAGPAPLRFLEPGELAVLPAFHFGFLYGDLDTCVQELHTHLRRSVIPPLPRGVAHPVGCNHTGYTQNAQITEECLFREVDVAADIGVELFIIDAGWFGDARSSWAQQVGDWEETPLLKTGLKSVCDRIRARGMTCGIWAEVERMVPTSRTAQAHPEWFMRRRGLPIHQLDLARPEVERHVEDTIARLVDRYELGCFRLDYNISVHEGSERETRDAAGRLTHVENTMWRYYDALWRIFDRLRARFPHLILENCSSGGGRTDLGMMSRFHWTQVTDNWEPQGTLKIVNGMTLSLPPEQVMTLPGAISPGVSDLDFMLRIGLFGHYCISGIYPSPEEIHAESIERWRHAIRIYKEFVRPFLHESRIYHHTPLLSHSRADEWCVLELVSADASRACVGVWRLPGATSDAYHFRPRGLHPGWRYRLIHDNTGQERVLDGGVLRDHGVMVPVGGTGCSELLLLDVVT
jgi:alpha-galactosidase